MNMQILVHIGFLYFAAEMKLFILIVLAWNIFLKKLKNSVMCGYFCIGFIDFMLAGKTLTDYTNLFSPYDFNKSDQIILSYFKGA